MKTTPPFKISNVRTRALTILTSSGPKVDGKELFSFDVECQCGERWSAVHGKTAGKFRQALGQVYLACRSATCPYTDRRPDSDFAAPSAE